MPSQPRRAMLMNETANSKMADIVPFFAALAPALAFSTSSIWLCMGCAAIMLLSGCTAIVAIRCFKSNTSALPQLAALMTAAAVSVGGRLIFTAAFPLKPDGGFFALAGAPLFFSACFATSTAQKTFSESFAFVSFGAALVVLSGLVRRLFSFMPLSAHISSGLVAAAVTVAAVRIFTCGREEIYGNRS